MVKAFIDLNTNSCIAILSDTSAEVFGNLLPAMPMLDVVNIGSTSYITTDNKRILVYTVTVLHGLEEIECNMIRQIPDGITEVEALKLLHEFNSK